MTPFGHGLVVGGSGMLAPLACRLLAEGNTLDILARDGMRICAAVPGARALACDYNDPLAIENALTVACARPGPPALIVAWIHPAAPRLRRRLAEAVSPGGRFVQVLGSAHGDPAHPERLASMAEAASGLDLVYQAVVLGFVVEAGGSRWLSHTEISEGVYAALASAAPLSVVGTLAPWSARP